MKRLLLVSNSFWSTTDELIWFPRKRGSKTERSSSIMMLPTDGLAKLNVINRYSGKALSGCSRTFLTLENSPWDSERVMSLSTSSTDCQTSIISVDSPLSLISWRSEIAGALFFNLLNWIDFSFLVVNWVMQF